MKTYILALSLLFVAVSCSNVAKNKIAATNSQEVINEGGKNLEVDLSQSSISWKGMKPGGSHVGKIYLKSGSLAVNDTTVTSGSFVINMDSIVDEDLTDAKMNKMLTDHLKSADFFDVTTYPEAVFTITKVQSVPANDSITHTISGNLKMKDVEKNISFGAKITKEGNVYKAETVSFSIDRTQWNVKYGSKTLFADLKDKFINDEIELKITIVAKSEQ